jgi:hypothetical protein
MNLSQYGLTVWYGTPDAPAPALDEVAPRTGVSIVIGAHPWNPTNVVRVSYRVDNGHTRNLPGREIRIDHARGSQYFAVVFPPFITGERVEYAVSLQCGGRQVPTPQQPERFPGRFYLASKPSYSKQSCRARPIQQRS